MREAQIGERTVSTERSRPTNSRPEYASSWPEPREGTWSKRKRRRRRREVRKVEEKGRREEVMGEEEWAHGNSRLSFVMCMHMATRLVVADTRPTTYNLKSCEHHMTIM